MQIKHMAYNINELNVEENENRSKFIDFCTYQMSDDCSRFLYEMMVEKFGNETVFFHSCAPIHYVYATVGLNSLDKHSPKYLYWNSVDVTWKLRLNCTKQELKSLTKYKSIW